MAKQKATISSIFGGDTIAKNIEENDNNYSKDLFLPNASNQPDRTYQALVRFVPNIKDPENCIIKKETCYLRHPLTNQGMSVDSLSSIGEKCPIKEMFFALHKLGDPRKSIFYCRQTYSAIVQVIKDEKNPENNGKLLVWRFGKTIYDKIMGEIKPAYGAPHNPFNPLTSRYFLVSVKVKAKFNNYDDCRFIDVPQNKPMAMINPETKENLGEVSDENTDAFMKWLDEFAPSLEDYKFKPWDAETKTFVHSVIDAVSNPNANRNPMVNQPVVESSNDDLFNAFGGVTSTPAVPKQEVQEPKPQPSTSSNNSILDDLLDSPVGKKEETADSVPGSLNIDDLISGMDDLPF